MNQKLSPAGRFLPAAAQGEKSRALSGQLRCGLLLRLAVVAWLVLLASPRLQAQVELTVCDFEELQEAVAEGGTITFGCDDSIIFTDTITVSKDTVLDATGASIIFAGDRPDDEELLRRLFVVNPGVRLTLINLAVVDGVDTNGGAIYNLGTLILEDVAFTNNFASGFHGTDGADGRDDEFEGRDGRSGTAGQGVLGGAIYSAAGALVQATRCLFITNSAAAGSGGNGGQGGNGIIAGSGGRGGRGGDAFGGAIYSLGTLHLTNCTFAFNNVTAGDGGEGGEGGQGTFGGHPADGGSGGSGAGAAVYTKGPGSIVACTFHDNVAESGDSGDGGRDSNGLGRDGVRGPDSLGGGVANFGTNVVINCTFSSNEAHGGDGGNGGDGNFIGGDGGNGGHGWGGNYFSAGRTAVTNCTFADGFSSGGTNGVRSSSRNPGKDGSRGDIRGDNIANGSGVFVIKNSLLAGPPASTNTFSVTNIICETNLYINVQGRTNADEVVCTREISIRSDGVLLLNRLFCETNPISGTNLVAGPVSTNCTTNVVSDTVVRRPVNAYGKITDAGNNLSSDNTPRWTSSTSRRNLDPLVGALETQTGPMPFRPLLLDSPAVNAGDPNSSPETDQLGEERFGSAPDIGAVELEAVQVRGRITEGARGLADILLRVTGDVAFSGEVTKRTDKDGRYVFTLEPGEYQLAPDDPRYLFSPELEDLFLTDEDEDDIDFTAARVFSIEGRIAFNGQGISGVEVTAGAGPDAFSAITDGFGSYRIEGVPPGSYAIVPQPDDFAFVPMFSNVTVKADLKNINFTLGGTASIRGRITGASGKGLARVTVAIGTITTKTDANGDYSFAGLPDAAYSVVPSLPGYAFTPPSAESDIGGASVIDFGATRLFKLSGRVRSGGKGLPGVTVTANGSTMLTSLSGTYAFPDLPEGDYEVAVELPGYVFAPETRDVQLNKNRSGINFTASRLAIISGQITHGLAPLAGVLVELDDGETEETDSQGFFTFRDVMPGRRTVRPVENGFSFSPVTRTVKVGPDALSVNFTATATNSLSGRITLDGEPLSGATVSIGTRATSTDADGTYEFTGLAPETYVVTPSHALYSFLPTSLTRLVEGIVTDVNFEATSKRFEITGQITRESSPVSNVVVRLDDVDNTTTDANGVFTITELLPGSYRVTPILAGYGFTPTNRQVSVGPNALGVNFAATGTRTISGRITLTNAGLSGVTVSAGSRTGVTDANGNYVITGVAPGTHTVIPSHATHAFLPASTNVTVNNDLAGVNFIAGFRMAGRVTDGSNSVAGATITVRSASLTNTLTTDGNGQFSIALVPGTYTVTASRSPLALRPASRSVTIGPSRTDIDFFRVYSLEGTVHDGLTGLGGVTVSAVMGTTTNNAVSDGDGIFLFTELAGGSYSIRASRGSDTFHPPVQEKLVSAPSDTPTVPLDIPFVLVYFVSGQVTGTNPVANLSLTASNGTILAGTAITDANGNYVFTNLSQGTYAITPSRTNGTFTPPSTNVTIGPRIENLNFVRESLTPSSASVATISGRVTDGMQGLAGVRIVLAGATEAVTDTEGHFLFEDLRPGAYELTAPAGGVGFNPPTRVHVVPESVLDANFTANPPVLTDVRVEPDGTVRLSAIGLPGRTYVIQFSTESLVNWTTISTNAADANGILDAAHAAGGNRGFYRVKVPGP